MLSHVGPEAKTTRSEYGRNFLTQLLRQTPLWLVGKVSCPEKNREGDIASGSPLATPNWLKKTRKSGRDGERKEQEGKKKPKKQITSGSLLNLIRPPSDP